MDASEESAEYRQQQLLTYLGNKRQLLGPIDEAVNHVAESLGKKRLRVFDGFSGSGVVSRLLKSKADVLVVNDLERYAEVVSHCYLANRSTVPLPALRSTIEKLNAVVDDGCERRDGFIQRLYAPADDTDIRAGERVFYTTNNARRLDTYRQLIAEQDQALQLFLLGPLLAAGSVHANTAGVFKGFYKDRQSGIGKFGGSKGDALTRILGQVRLVEPVLSVFECEVQVYRSDTNALVHDLDDLDLAYFDPPYNQHPYGSNYFMLNLLADYVEPSEVSPVSGIPPNWNRSRYNVKRQALSQLAELVEAVDARFVLLSFSDEGFVSPEEVRGLLGRHGRVDEVTSRHTTFRGSRNLHQRSAHVTEHLYLLRKRESTAP